MDLALLGWDDRVAARLADGVPEGAVPARVVRVEHDSCTVATVDGDRRARARTLPAVGDWVAVRLDGDDAEVVAVADRWSELARRDPSGLTQVLAADVDIVFVTAPADRLSVARVERETAIAWDSGARPVVLVTKSDVAAPGTADDLRDRLVGVDVVATSTVTGDGIDSIVAALQPAKTAVLLGPSGAGKSSLANRLLGGELMATADVRAGDHRGRHTTTARQLLVVPTGGVLIDTPGVRSLSLPVDHGGVAAAFPEVEELAGGCRFRDCTHEHEPGCAVVDAVDPARLASYRKLRRELAFEARRDDPLAAREVNRMWKARMKDFRRLNRERG